MTTNYPPEMEKHVSALLKLVGEDPTRPGLKDTPRRFSRAFTEFTSGYAKDPVKEAGNALYDSEGARDIVLIRDIEFYSLCEHHLVPFYGRAHVAYIPNGRIIGLSKVPRIVDIFARRVQVQERMTMQIAEALMKILDPQGVSVILEAHHLCMMMRGVSKQNSNTVTSSVLGVFRDDARTRTELLQLLNGISLTKK